MLLSIVILTYNESANLPTCLASLQPLNAEIFIVDSGSSDRTINIAKQAGCQVFSHPWENYAKQMNWALQNLPISTPWIMRLDADERPTPELIEELQKTLPMAPEEIGGYQLKRRVFFMGRWIRHGGYYPTWLLRVWRTGLGICEQRWMDEHIVLKQGKIASFKNDIIDENHKGLSFWTDKHNRYADREVKDLLAQLEGQDDFITTGSISPSQSKTMGQEKSLRAIALFLRAFLYFIMRYIIGLGFLDGIEGLIFHFLQGFWYRFLVDAKIYELTRKKEIQPLGLSDIPKI